MAFRVLCSLECSYSWLSWYIRSQVIHDHTISNVLCVGTLSPTCHSKKTRQIWSRRPSVYLFFVWFDSLRPINNISVKPGLNQFKARINVSCSRTTTQWRRWGSNSRTLGLESSTLPLSHCVPSTSSLHYCVVALSKHSLWTLHPPVNTFPWVMRDAWL